jgi:hypothetical protein
LNRRGYTTITILVKDKMDCASTAGCFADQDAPVFEKMKSGKHGLAVVHYF